MQKIQALVRLERQSGAAMAKRWYSVSVLSNFEKKVAEQIRTAVADANLGDEIDEVLSVIGASLQQNSAFSETLSTLEQDLPQASSPEQFNSLVSGLIEENRRMSAMTLELNQGLARSQTLISTVGKARCGRMLHQSCVCSVTEPVS